MSVLVTGAGTAPYRPKSAFADNAWEDIVLACQSRKVPATWAVGDCKTMLIDNTEYEVCIIGKDHDTYYDDGSTAPLTLQLRGVYATAYRIHGSTGADWMSTEMRNTTLPNLQTQMPAAVSAAVREVTKSAYDSGSATSMSTFGDKLFLLSEVEVLGTKYKARVAEGKQYEYYKTFANIDKGVLWWTRSKGSSSSYFVYIAKGATAANTASNRGTMTDRNSVSFAFCF